MATNINSARKSYTFGGYEILDTAGAGGMGVVYRAVDRALGRHVALKVLRDDLRAQPILVARFQREAETVATLNHPNIVQIYSVGCIGRIPYIAMEYIEGQPLCDILQERGPLPWRETLDIIAQVAAALASAHDAKIIHRDIKPANILIDRNGRALVTDFGIAKVLSASTQLTTDGSRLGTPQYLCPERCQDQEISPASDVYSLGVVTFQCLTGKMPYEGASTVELIEKIVGEAPARVREFAPEVPESVERLVAFLLEKDPAKRPADAHVLGALVDRVRQGLPLDEHADEMSRALADFRRSLATPTSKSKPTTKSTTKHPLKKRVERRWFQWSSTTRIAIALVVILLLSLSLAATGYRIITGPALREIDMGPDLGVARWNQTPPPLIEFRQETPGVVLGRFALHDMTISQIHWAGGAWGAIVRLDGLANSERAGQSALIALDPESRQTDILLAPFFSSGDWKVLGYHSFADGQPGLLLSTPSATLWIDPFGRFLPVTVADLPSAALALHPDKTRLALAFPGVNQEQWILRETTFTAPDNKTPLTPPGKRIVCIQYSPDGNTIAYLRQDAPGENGSLWIKPAVDPENPGTLLSDTCIQLVEDSFHPAQAELLGVCRSAEGHDALVCFSLAPNTPAQSLGSARMGRWHPDGNTLLVIAEDNAGRPQLWRFSKDMPDNRTQLTFLESGVQSDLCILPGGGTAIMSQSDEPQLAFVQIP